MAWQVVIAGGGFGGFYAARALERLLPAQSARVTLVNDANFMLYTPLLPGAAGATLDPRHVVVPLRSQLRRTDLVIGQRDRRRPGSERRSPSSASTASSSSSATTSSIVALGSVSRTLPIPGLAEHAIGLKSLADATALRNQVLDCLDIAESLEDPALRAEYLGFVFVGAGYAGVEGLAELQDFAAQAIELYPRCARRACAGCWSRPRERIMQEVPASLSEFAERELRGRGIEVRTGTTLRERQRRAARRSPSGETIAARTVVWTAGVRPSPVVARLGLPLDRDGRVVVDSTMRVRSRARRHAARRRPRPDMGDRRLRRGPRRLAARGSRVRRPPSTRSARAAWSRATSPRRSQDGARGRFATGPKAWSPSSATTRRSRSRSVSAGAGCRPG